MTLRNLDGTVSKQNTKGFVSRINVACENRGIVMAKIYFLLSLTSC